MRRIILWSIIASSVLHLRSAHNLRDRIATSNVSFPYLSCIFLTYFYETKLQVRINICNDLMKIAHIFNIIPSVIIFAKNTSNVFGNKISHFAIQQGLIWTHMNSLSTVIVPHFLSHMVHVRNNYSHHYPDFLLISILSKQCNTYPPKAAIFQKISIIDVWLSSKYASEMPA